MPAATASGLPDDLDLFSVPDLSDMVYLNTMMNSSPGQWGGSVNSLNWTYAERPDLPEWAFPAASAYLALVGLVGVGANAAGIITYLRNKEVRMTNS